jgi:hypothetical protein
VLLLASNLFPIFLAALAWWVAPRQNAILGRYRLLAFRFGLCLVTASSVLLVTFVLYSLKSNGSFAAHDFASHILWIPSLVLAIVGIPLVLCGKSTAAVLAVGTAFLDLGFLYIAGLATSY